LAFPEKGETLTNPGEPASAVVIRDEIIEAVKKKCR